MECSCSDKGDAVTSVTSAAVSRRHRDNGTSMRQYRTHTKACCIKKPLSMPQPAQRMYNPIVPHRTKMRKGAK